METDIARIEQMMRAVTGDMKHDGSTRSVLESARLTARVNPTIHEAACEGHS